MKKRVAAAVLCLLLLTFGNVYAFANPFRPIMEPERVIEIQPFWSNIASMSVTLSFHSGRGELSAHVTGQPGTERITANVVLDRQNADGSFTHVQTWHNINNIPGIPSVLSWGATHWVIRGHNYRITLNANVTRHGFTESASISRITFAD